MSMMITLQDKAAQLRRDHILEAATKVFAAKGFHRATIRDIAREAGVADGTIYTSFENKAALLLAVLDPLDEASADPMPLLPEVDLRQFLTLAIQHRFEHMTEAKLAVLRVVLSEALVNEELRMLYVERVLRPALTIPLPQLEALAAAGKLKTPDAELALRLVVGAVLGLSMLRLTGDAIVKDRWDEMGALLADALLTGLSSSGRKVTHRD